MFPPVVGSNPIPSGDGRINTSLLSCVAYVLTLDRAQQSVGPRPPAPLLFIPPEWRVKPEDGGDHEEDTGLATESIRRL